MKRKIHPWEIDPWKPWHSILVLNGCTEELKKYPPYKLVKHRYLLHFFNFLSIVKQWRIYEK